jgi:hypothetical protein
MSEKLSSARLSTNEDVRKREKRGGITPPPPDTLGVLRLLIRKLGRKWLGFVLTEVRKRSFFLPH